jgi:hypothetical protein
MFCSTAQRVSNILASAMMMEAAKTAAILLLLSQSIYHQPPENNKLPSYHSDCSRLSKLSFNFYDFLH